MTFILSILLGLWGKFRGYVIGAGVALSILLGAYAKGYSDQKQRAEAAAATQKAKDLKTAKDIENEISKKSDAAVNADLAKWMRD